MESRTLDCALLFLVCWAAWVAAAAESDGATPSSERGRETCSALTDCGSCLRTLRCHWCASTDPKQSRCVHESKAIGSWCKGFTWEPKQSYNATGNETGKSQLFPMRAVLQLRVGETKRINVTFRRLEDYPIDLYYLLDLSETMSDDITQISELGEKLALEMQNVTKNFRLGFGSFVDKVEMPFVFPKLANSGYAAPYSFKNHLPLSNNIKEFSEKLKKSPVSTNNDAPEGGLDALMQAMVCTEEIKWRPDARHLLVFVTDEVYHIAGDGKLSGAVEPNPEICIMKNNEYTGYADYDYPTIYQIKKNAVDNKINIIFAVKEKVSQQYSQLSKLVDGSRMEILKQKSTNIISIIKENYSKFEKSIKLLDDAGGKGIGIIYYSRCSEGGNIITTNECNNIKATEPVLFEVDITAKTCPSNLDNYTWKTKVNIAPNGINETFQLDIEVYCSCPCEFEGHEFYKRNSSVCRNHGIQKCGICECDEMSIGEYCECERDSKNVEVSADLSVCMADNDTKSVCSDRGSCVCGKCQCNKRQNSEEMYYGVHCQCDNFSCKRHNDILCSGAERGQCVCGKCQCEVGWTGEGCECPEMQTGCVAPGEDEVCSGFGRCVCGKCECEEKRSGKYCGDCMQTINVTCPAGRCREFADCVECMVHETGKYSGPLCSNCSIPKLLEEESLSETSLPMEERYCKVPDDAGCSFVFTYLEEPVLTLRAVKTKECPPPVNLLGIVLGVGGTTLFLGLLGILVWKLLTSMHDRREYAKYIQELENTTWSASTNPQYQEPTTTTMNPTYHSRKSRFSFMMR